MVYEDKREVERTVTPELAKQIIETVSVSIPVSETAPTTADVCKAIDENAGSFSEELKLVIPQIREALEQNKREEPVTVEKLSAVSYTETVTISEAMGHDSETTTRIYLASLDTSMVDKANSLILKLLL